MTDFQKLTEMVREDKFLYKAINDIADNSVTTGEIYDIWLKLHKAERWSIKQIEEMING